LLEKPIEHLLANDFSTAVRIKSSTSNSQMLATNYKKRMHLIELANIQQSSRTIFIGMKNLKLLLMKRTCWVCIASLKS